MRSGWDMPLASSYAEYYGAASAAEIIAAIKADAELGTAAGGLVANAAQVLNVQRASEPVSAGGPVTETWTKIADTASTLVVEKVVS